MRAKAAARDEEAAAPAIVAAFSVTTSTTRDFNDEAVLTIAASSRTKNEAREVDGEARAIDEETCDEDEEARDIDEGVKVVEAAPIETNAAACRIEATLARVEETAPEFNAGPLAIDASLPSFNAAPPSTDAGGPSVVAESLLAARPAARYIGEAVNQPHLNGNGHAEANHAAAASAVLEEARAAVARGRVAQQRWKLEPLADRVAALTRAAKSMLRHRDEVIALARDEMGKVDAEGMFNEALGPLDTVSAWARIVGEASTRHVRLNPINFPRKQARVDMVPRGVVGIIAPWNYPVAGLYRSTIPALLTGNAIVVKPSEYTPRTSAWLVERLAAELPRGLAQVLFGDGRAGAALVDAGIDACVFTGSPQTGRKVRVQCAERGIPASVEMGGKDAAIVLADCDLSRTVAGVTHWALSNAGQACGAIEIAYVDERIADAFVGALRSAWTRLRVGGRHADVAALANERQLEIVEAQVEDARAKGAVVVCGGRPTGGLGYEPTVLDRCDDRMNVVRDETFGPVLAVVRVSGAAEAVRSVNAARYGLGTSIWTRDIARAGRLAERLEVGVVTVNNHAFSGAIPALPWSGTRETGFGIANGPEALSTFVRPRAIIVDRASGPELFWMPYDDALYELGDILADAQLARLERVWRLPMLMRRRIKKVRDFFR